MSTHLRQVSESERKIKQLSHRLENQQARVVIGDHGRARGSFQEGVMRCRHIIQRPRSFQRLIRQNQVGTTF